MHNVQLLIIALCALVSQAILVILSLLVYCHLHHVRIFLIFPPLALFIIHKKILFQQLNEHLQPHLASPRRAAPTPNVARKTVPALAFVLQDTKAILMIATEDVAENAKLTPTALQR
jgi:hypothetical protein